MSKELQMQYVKLLRKNRNNSGACFSSFVRIIGILTASIDLLFGKQFDGLNMHFLIPSAVSLCMQFIFFHFRCACFH